MWLRALTIWCAILVLAFANGAFRQLLLVPRLGAIAGGQISVALLSSAIAAVAWGAIGWIDPFTARDAAGIGLLWLALTLAFEFLGGHYLFGTPWDVLVADYRVDQGRLWPVVLAVTLAAPTGAWLLRR